MEPRHKRGIAIAALVLLASLAMYFVVRSGTDQTVPQAATQSSPAASPAEVPAPAPSPTESAAAAPEEPVVEPSSEAPEPSGVAERSNKRGDGEPRGGSEKAKALAPPTAAARAPEPPPDAGAPAAADAGAPAATAAAKKAGEDAVMVGHFTNRAGKQFKLLRVSVTLDGQTVYSGAGGPSVEIFRRAATPGDHTVAVVAEYQGNGGGVFSYFDGFRFMVRGNRAFAAKPEGRTNVTVAVSERGGTLTPHEQRLGLSVSVN